MSQIGLTQSWMIQNVSTIAAKRPAVQRRRGGGEFQDWEGATACWAAERYDPRSGRWENLPRMRLVHRGFAAGFIGDDLHVAGGGFNPTACPCGDQDDGT